MEQATEHRKKVRHFNHPNQFHELTFSCYRRLPLLVAGERFPMLTGSIERAMHGHGYALIAFVYMPEHVHLLVFPSTKASGVDRLLNAIKRPFSYRIKQSLTQSGDPLLGQLTIRQRPGVMRFRFWQEGPGYDRNLVSLVAASAALDYIHRNPVRRGIAENELDWHWSSARQYLEPYAAPNPELPSVTRLGEQIFD